MLPPADEASKRKTARALAVAGIILLFFLCFFFLLYFSFLFFLGFLRGLNERLIPKHLFPAIPNPGPSTPGKKGRAKSVKNPCRAQADR